MLGARDAGDYQKNKGIVLCTWVLLTNFVVINILINNLKKQTMSAIEIITNELQTLGSTEKAAQLSRFFKTGKGQYGENDRFLGVTVPQTRRVAMAHAGVNMADLQQLIRSEWHEVRLCALFILTIQFNKGDEPTRTELVHFYLNNTQHTNNWDLVDLSAWKTIGTYLLDRPRNLLYRLAESPLLWDNRIAMVSTYAFIRQGQLDDTFALAEKMMGHKHDLMHKAIGWMLREAGKRDEKRLIDFVENHRLVMPRTMLRYAIEKLSTTQRKHLMRKD